MISRDADPELPYISTASTDKVQAPGLGRSPSENLYLATHTAAALS